MHLQLFGIPPLHVPSTARACWGLKINKAATAISGTKVAKITLTIAELSRSFAIEPIIPEEVQNTLEDIPYYLWYHDGKERCPAFALPRLRGAG